MAELLEDKRFAHIGRDPRFRQMKKQHHKVKIDQRFKGMFNDKRFKVKYMVDKRGRPVQTSSSDHLRQYYHLSSSEEEEDSETEEEEGEESDGEEEGKGLDTKKKDKQDRGKQNKVDKKKKVKDRKKKTKTDNEEKELDDESEDDRVATGEVSKSKMRKDILQKRSQIKNISISSNSAKSRTNKAIDTDSDEEESSEVDDADISDEETKELYQDVAGKTPDFARGEGLDTDSDDSEDSHSEPDIEHDWAELDKDAPEAEEVTRRLAVCNMDWDRIKAVDLLVLFNSFKPPDGVIHSVTIYPSDFGLARMKEEETCGPVELVTHTEDAEDEETEYNTERLRQYQLKRLKYYYAVVECDTPETASAIYSNCDGTEYESSAAKLDLRYIPDDMTFDQEVKSAAGDVPSNYTPSLFVTTALQQSNVELTWDETNKDRIAVTMRRFNKDELDEMDLNDYLASDDDDAPDPYGDLLEPPTFGVETESGEGEDKDRQDGEEEAVRKYQALLKGIQAETRRKEDKGVEMEVSWGLGLKETTEDLVKKAQKEESTPWETYLQKRREKNRAKREDKKKTPDAAMEDTAAFSDDELPGGNTEDFFTDTLSGGKEDKKRTKKKKKPQIKLTTEEKAKQKEDKAELSLLMMDEDDDREHFSLKEIQEKEKMTKRRRRRKRQAEEEAAAIKDTFQMDLSDNRFEAVFTNPLYNIDPSSHEFKKTKAIENLIDEKVKRVRQEGKSTVKSRAEKVEKTRVGGEENSRNDSLQSTDALKLESLIKSVKVKTKLLQDKKKKKLK